MPAPAVFARLRNCVALGLGGTGLKLCAAPDAAPPAAVPPLLPVEDFARAPQFLNMQLSPDGTCVGYLRLEDSGSGFLTANLSK